MNHPSNRFLKSSFFPPKRWFFFLTILFLATFSIAQEDSLKQEKKESFRAMFYNVENYFDAFDDPLIDDSEYLPNGIRNWNYSRFIKKRNNIYKIILAVGGWSPPAIIGLCEIENYFVLKQLVYETPFSKFDYRIVHQESPDRRGIDVALLFDPKIFQLITHQAIPLNFPDNPESKTRDILYAQGIVFGTDTLHIFVNHWPSRYGGELSSESRRHFAAAELAKYVDAILSKNKEANILIMGDFNDTPTDQSIKEILKAGNLSKENRLANLMRNYNGNLSGTNKFNGDWAILDQMMVSPALVSKENNFFVEGDAQIFNSAFLLEKDTKFLGNRPFRTFLGMKYSGGFSDHLPVFVDFHEK